ncbi:hypothetical protein ACSFVZ_16700 [Pseudoalteromonas sp. SYSU M81236]|jgi:hypothetical protein|uniref:hypothetical protein n=1 Tax=unclassified Pseudoalteromonas TaxID=194690 RepID=UPI001F31ED89|nr:hypothetical protein [Pseudoalteromonas sp. OFAV1]MCF2900600.1 hypothetical protein [Pseudoalteromonas sp. OFAV1]|tara:strand:+ start:645 stop:2141 length:1497 start_codon:yes stop_codon:yes gene_type:complete
MNNKLLKVVPSIALAFASLSACSSELPKEVRWMQDAKWGISHHYLAGGTLDNAWYQITDYDEWNNYVNGFDVDAYAQKAEKLGYRYVIFTLTQNRGYLSTTSEIYDLHSPACPKVEVAPGCKTQLNSNQADYTPSRDLVLDLALALKAKGIKLIAYLPSHLGDRWTGTKVKAPYPDWFLKGFISERAKKWGDNIAGWWFDGWYQADESEQELAANNAYPVADKLAESVRSGNPNAVITISDGFDYSFIPNDPQSNYTQGEHNELPPIPESGEVTTALGTKVQWHGFTYTSLEDPLFGGWGQVKRSLKYSNEEVAERVKAISQVGGVTTLDVAINPNGTWLVDRLVQIQTVGNTVGTTQDTTYSGLELVNDDDPRIQYSENGNWQSVSQTNTGEYKQDMHITEVNGAYFSYQFTGSSIVFATSKAANQGDVEVILDGQSQGTYSIFDGNNYRQVQSIVFEKHDLAAGPHTLTVKKVSGDVMPVDVVLSKKPEEYKAKSQ